MNLDRVFDYTVLTEGKRDDDDESSGGRGEQGEGSQRADQERETEFHEEHWAGNEDRNDQHGGGRRVGMEGAGADGCCIVRESSRTARMEGHLPGMDRRGRRVFGVEVPGDSHAGLGGVWVHGHHCR